MLDSYHLPIAGMGNTLYFHFYKLTGLIEVQIRRTVAVIEHSATDQQSRILIDKHARINAVQRDVLSGLALFHRLAVHQFQSIATALPQVQHMVSLSITIHKDHSAMVVRIT